MSRWAEINRFAQRAGFKIAFNLNACWGRASASSEMDFSMIKGLFAATARMAANKSSAVWAFEFGNELYSNVEGSRCVLRSCSASTAAIFTNSRIDCSDRQAVPPRCSVVHPRVRKLLADANTMSPTTQHSFCTLHAGTVQT